MALEYENHVIDLLPDFVLEMLSDDETNQVADHLAGCPNCRAELSHLQQVADEIPLALVQTSPSPALKTRLMEAIHNQPSATLLPTRQTYWQKLSHSLQMPWPAIGLAIIVILVLGNLLLLRQLNLNSLNATVSMRVVALANNENSPGAIGTLVIDPHGNYGTLVVDNLTPLAPDRQYQVWLLKGDARTSGGLFSVNYQGYASLEITAPLPLASYDSIGISVEPSGGSSEPTGLKVMGIDLLK
jgi:anti-sigma-K factor RskA